MRANYFMLKDKGKVTLIKQSVVPKDIDEKVRIIDAYYYIEKFVISKENKLSLIREEFIDEQYIVANRRKLQLIKKREYYTMLLDQVIEPLTRYGKQLDATIEDIKYQFRAILLNN